MLIDRIGNMEDNDAEPTSRSADWKGLRTETMNLNDILEDLRLADEAIHRFERRYGVTSEQFYSLYAAGKLDDGQHAEEFSEWAGFYRLKLRREQAFRDLSLQRVRQLQAVGADGLVLLEPHNIMADAT